MSIGKFQVMLPVMVLFIINSHCAEGSTKWDGAKIVDGKCFLLVLKPVPWSTAKTACEGMEGTLATITSQEQISAISLAFNWYKNLYWIGANDITNEGTFVWTEDGSSASAFDGMWVFGRPLTYPGNDFDCVYVTRDKTVIDVHCEDNSVYYLCMEPNSKTTKCQDPSTTFSTTTEGTPTTPTTPTTQKPRKPCKKG